MKNLKFCFVVWLLLCFAHASSAQTEKGTWLAGGSGWFQTLRDNPITFASLNLRPQAGYFFRDNLAGGLASFLSPNIALEATLDYRNLSSQIEQRALYLQLGVFTYLRGRK